MNEITKELLEALQDCERVMSAELKGLLVIQPELKKARAAIAKAEATLAAPQPSADAVEAAFREGFRSPTTYNDTVMNSEDDAWGNSEARAEAAKAAPQPADDGWIPWEGGERPVTHNTTVEVRLRNGWEGDLLASAWHWHHATQESSDAKEVDIIAYRVVKP